MSESLGHQGGRKPERTIPIVRSAGNVALRFESYETAAPAFDIREEIFRRLGLAAPYARPQRIVDVGSNDGSLIFWARSHGYDQHEYIGEEPDPAVRPHFHNLRNLKFYKHDAQHLYGNQVDVLLALFMMYFIPPNEQAMTLERFKAALTPPVYDQNGGKLVVATSGDFNKVRQRGYEHTFAEWFEREPPDQMNAWFNSERAKEVLPGYFKNVYHGSYKGHMVIRTQEDIKKYYHSLISMKRFFKPPIGGQPDDEKFEEIFKELILPIIAKEINQLGQFIDYVERDFFICNDALSGMDIWEADKEKWRTVYGYEHEDLGQILGGH